MPPEDRPRYYASNRQDNADEAVRLLAEASKAMDEEREQTILMRAQVHATLALMLAENVTATYTAKIAEAVR